MNDRMTPIPFGQLMNWILSQNQAPFGISHLFKAVPQKTFNLFNEKFEVPCGPAAGPHTQLTQNIIAAYLAGARFFELKTVQTLDGEDLPVAKPCINASDECYNVEWSTELTVPDALEEYVKAWFALKLIAKEYKLGDPDGFIFNMSVGYDLKGIKSPKIDNFIEGLKNASHLTIWNTCTKWTKANLDKFHRIDEAYIDQISPHVSSSVTLSTLHGCPPDEIERIATYLIGQKGLHTYIKCNPTLLGYPFARGVLDQMGYDYIAFDDHHFKDDLQFEDAVPMIKRLMTLATSHMLTFGVKLTNTFPVEIKQNELPGDEMYMSGRSLFPLTISLAYKLAKTFEGYLNISFSGGVDAFNIQSLFQTGIYPITLATTLLKPGGYNRLHQMAQTFNQLTATPTLPIDLEALHALMEDAYTNPHYMKPIKPLPSRKLKEAVPLLDCTFAPCTKGCPIEQDIPEYMRLVGEGKYLEALKVITLKNPLPFVTGTICNHNCTTKCRRNFYEEEMSIREVKLEAAKKGFDDLMDTLEIPSIISPHKVAIIGSGPAGLAAAYFLAKEGMDVTVFEKQKSLGGIVRHIVPDFRMTIQTVQKDIRFINQSGVKFEPNHEITSIEALKKKGFHYVIVATGAWRPGTLPLEGATPLNVLDFLGQFKVSPDTLNLGKNVAVVGGGNTAMDAARAAKRVPGVENVFLVYRRTKRYMPADEDELLLALEEGVVFKELLSPISLKEGKLSCYKMKLGAPDASGRREPLQTEEITEIPVDTLIAAVGEQIDVPFFEHNQIPLNAKGKVCYDPGTLEATSNLFVIGDARSGPSTVVMGIQDATLAAKTILEREQLRPTPIATKSSCVCATTLYDKKGVLLPKKAIDCEAMRCLSCDQMCECCVDVCPNRANMTIDIKGHKQILHIDRMCNECGNCTLFCPYTSSPYKDKFTLFHTLEEFDSSSNQGFFVINLKNAHIKVRLEDQVEEITLANWASHPEIKAFISTILNDYAYLL